MQQNGNQSEESMNKEINYLLVEDLNILFVFHDTISICQEK